MPNLGEEIDSEKKESQKRENENKVTKELWYVNPNYKGKKYSNAVFTFEFILILLGLGGAIFGICSYWNKKSWIGSNLEVIVFFAFIFVVWVIFVFAILGKMTKKATKEIQISGNDGMCGCGYFFQPKDIDYHKVNTSQKSISSEDAYRTEYTHCYAVTCKCPNCHHVEHFNVYTKTSDVSTYKTSHKLDTWGATEYKSTSYGSDDAKSEILKHIESEQMKKKSEISDLEIDGWKKEIRDKK